MNKDYLLKQIKNNFLKKNEFYKQLNAWGFYYITETDLVVSIGEILSKDYQAFYEVKYPYDGRKKCDIVLINKKNKEEIWVECKLMWWSDNRLYKNRFEVFKKDQEKLRKIDRPECSKKLFIILTINQKDFDYQSTNTKKAHNFKTALKKLKFDFDKSKKISKGEYHLTINMMEVHL